MKRSNLFLIGFFILPWLTVPLLGKRSFKHDLPAALFMATFTKALDMYGEKKKWWRFYKGILRFKSVDFLNYGPFLVTSLWMLKKTYGNFFLFILANTTLQSMFTFAGLKYIKSFKIAALVKLTKWQYLAIDVLRSIVLYSFQFIRDLSPDEKLEKHAKEN